MHGVHRSWLWSCSTHKVTPATGVGRQQRGSGGPTSQKSSTVEGGLCMNHVWRQFSYACAALHRPARELKHLMSTATRLLCQSWDLCVVWCCTAWHYHKGMEQPEGSLHKGRELWTTCTWCSPTLPRHGQYCCKRGRRAAQLWVQICPL